jgi:predicted anti-sigma-YlaC factor YlaD
MELSAFRRLLQNIAETEDEEISCTECLELVPQYVDLEVAGQADDRTLSRLQRHLRQCSVCREEYEALRDLVLDTDRRPPDSD